MCTSKYQRNERYYYYYYYSHYYYDYYYYFQCLYNRPIFWRCPKDSPGPQCLSGLAKQDILQVGRLTSRPTNSVKALKGECNVRTVWT